MGQIVEGYWHYLDDVDWCFRFHLKGGKVWHDRRSQLLHVKGGTTVFERRRSRHRGLRHNVAFHRSTGRFYRNFYGGRRTVFDLVIYLTIGMKLAIATVRSTLARRRLV